MSRRERESDTFGCRRKIRVSCYVHAVVRSSRSIFFGGKICRFYRVSFSYVPRELLTFRMTLSRYVRICYIWERTDLKSNFTGYSKGKQKGRKSNATEIPHILCSSLCVMTQPNWYYTTKASDRCKMLCPFLKMFKLALPCMWVAGLNFCVHLKAETDFSK